MQQKPQQCSTSCSQQPPQQKWNKRVDKKKGSLKNIKQEGQGKAIGKQEKKSHMQNKELTMRGVMECGM